MNQHCIFGIQYPWLGIAENFLTKPNLSYIFPSILMLVFSTNGPQIKKKKENIFNALGDFQHRSKPEQKIRGGVSAPVY